MLHSSLDAPTPPSCHATRRLQLLATYPHFAPSRHPLPLPNPVPTRNPVPTPPLPTLELLPHDFLAFNAFPLPSPSPRPTHP